MALSEVLPFDQWVDSEEAQGLEGLDKVQAYGDHYRSSKFASGSLNPQEAAQVDNELFQLARNSGLIDAEDDAVAEQQYYSRPEKPLTDEDLAKVVAHKYENKAAGEDQVREYLAMRNVEGAPEELVAEKEALANVFLTKEDLSAANRASALRGDQAFYVEQDEEGNLDIEIDPNLEEETLTNERIAQIAKDQGINTRFLPAIRSMLDKPAGLTVSRAKAVRNAELRDVFSRTEDEDLKFFRDYVVQHVANGDYEAAAENAANAAHYGSLSKQFSREDIVNGLVDYAKYVAGNESPEFLSTGEVVMPSQLHTRKEDFDAAVDALDISDERKALTKAGRDAKMEAMSAHFHKVASSVGESDYTAHYESGKAAGKTDAQIVEEWFSDDENYNKAKQVGQGVFVGVLEGFSGLILYPMALAGNEDARRTVGAFMRDESNRQEYAALFGEELGIGYSILRTAPSVVADIAISIPTGGVVGGLTAGTRWTMKQGAKLAFRQSLSPSTKAATGVALKKGTAGSVTKALRMTGDDFTKKLGTFAYQSAAIAPSAFNRSAGATYTSVYSSLETQHPDWSPQQVREAAYGHAVVSGAITVGITSAFNGLAQAFPKYFGSGVEEWAKGTGGGLTIRQMRTAYSKLATAPGKIPKEIRNYIKLDSFEEFVGSVAKEGMRNSWLKHTVRQTGSEAFEEGLDEFINGWRQSAFLNEDKNILDHLKSAGHAAVIGGVFGAGGAFKEGGVRSSLTDSQTRAFEQDAFSTVAQALENGGDTESATVLRGLIARSRSRKRTVTDQLESVGNLAARQESRVASTTAPIEKILKADPTVPSGLQRELTKAEEFLARYDGVDPSKLTTRDRVNIAAARIYQRRLTDTFNRAETAAIEGIESDARPEGALTTDSGTVVGRDRGTKHSEFSDKYDPKTPEEADTVLTQLNEEITRLGSRGDQATAYQNERVKHLSTHRDRIRAQFKSDEPGTQSPTKAQVSRAKPSKLELQLRNTESGLASLRRLERANPAVKNTPAHRARKVALRSRRRAVREALASESSSARKPVSWRQYPLEKIAAQFSPVPGAKEGILLVKPEDSPVFNPADNTQFDPNIDPEAAVAAIEKASNEKRKLDNATIKKIEQGKSVTDLELESLATEDPDVQYAETLENLQTLVSALNPSIVSDSDSPNPDKVRKVRALQVAHTAALENEAQAEINLIPAEAEGVEEAVEAIANEVSASDPGPSPRTAEYTVEGTKKIVRVTEEGVAVLDNGEQQGFFPATSFDEADATARKLLGDSGEPQEKINRAESETDPRTEAEAAIASGDTTPIESAAGTSAPPATPEQNVTEEEAKAEYIAAELEAIQSSRPVSEVLAQKLEEEKRSVNVVEEIVPLLSTQPPKGWSVLYRGGPVAIKGYDPEKHDIATSRGKHRKHYKKGEIVVISKKTGRPLKRETKRLSGEDVTLYDVNGSPQFLSPEDKSLFYDLLERGVLPEVRAFHSGTYGLTSHNPYYLNPFLRTLRSETLKRYPPVEAPPKAMFKTDPGPISTGASN